MMRSLRVSLLTLPPVAGAFSASTCDGRPRESRAGLAGSSFAWLPTGCPRRRASSSLLTGCAEPLDELEHCLGDLPPASVDCERVPPVRHLDDFGHALVALLLLVGGVRDGPGDRLVRVGRDDQHRTPIRIRRVDLCL